MAWKEITMQEKVNIHNFIINPLTPRRALVAPFTEISILFKEGIIKKKIPMSVAPMSR